MQQVFDIHAPRYERGGECRRCGACCAGEGCEHLLVGDDGATCAIVDSPDRPLKCRLFPAAPPIVFRGCGYFFLDRWDDNRIVRGRV